MLITSPENENKEGMDKNRHKENNILRKTPWHIPFCWNLPFVQQDLFWFAAYVLSSKSFILINLFQA